MDGIALKLAGLTKGALRGKKAFRQQEHVAYSEMSPEPCLGFHCQVSHSESHNF